MIKIIDLKEITEINSYSMSDNISSFSKQLTQIKIQSDYDAQSIVNSILFITESLARSEINSDDLCYQFIE